MHPKSWFASLLSLLIAFFAVAAAHASGGSGGMDKIVEDNSDTIARFFNDNYKVGYVSDTKTIITFKAFGA